MDQTFPAFFIEIRILFIIDRLPSTRASLFLSLLNIKYMCTPFIIELKSQVMGLAFKGIQNSE